MGQAPSGPTVIRPLLGEEPAPETVAAERQSPVHVYYGGRTTFAKVLGSVGRTSPFHRRNSHVTDSFRLSWTRTLTDVVIASLWMGFCPGGGLLSVSVCNQRDL